MTKVVKGFKDGSFVASSAEDALNHCRYLGDKEIFILGADLIRMYELVGQKLKVAVDPEKWYFVSGSTIEECE